MRWRRASAKINLTLRVIGRRADGYHDLESLVAFAGLCDWLAFEPGDDLIVEVLGSRAGEAGPVEENLVARAARALAAQIPELKLGRFRLVKHLPAAAGLGGGSADAAAALRLLADEAGFSSRRSASACLRACDGSRRPCLPFSASPNHEGNWRQARSGYSASKIVCAPRQSPGSCADAGGVCRPRPCAWIDVEVAGSIVSRTRI